MIRTGICRHMDPLGRFKIPKEFLDSCNLKPHSLIKIYQKEKNIMIESLPHNCIFCDSEKNIHKFENKFICNSCINEIRELININ